MKIDRNPIAAFLGLLFREDSGFAESTAELMGSVSSMNSALKALIALGLPTHHSEQCISFIERCFDIESGGFAQSPGDDASPFATASALIVLSTLDAVESLKTFIPPSVKYMREESTTQYDHFMTIAAWEECGLDDDVIIRSVTFFESKYNADGLFGANVLENAVASTSLLRAGLSLPNPEAVGQSMLSAQNNDGGFGDGGVSDLMTTYCVVRLLVLLDQPPNVRALTQYIERLSAGHGFATAKNGKATAGATYQVLAISEWLSELQRAALDMARDGDVVGLRNWLAGGGDPNQRDTEGWTVLLAAAARGKAEVVNLLLNHTMDGASRSDPEMRFLDADALPVYMAGQSGDLETTKLLLKANPAHVHAISKVNGHTLFLQAAFYGKSQHLILAEWLLENICEILDLPEDRLTEQQLKLATATNVRGYSGLTMQKIWNNMAMEDLLQKYPQPTEDERQTYLDSLLLDIADSRSLTEMLIANLMHWLEKAAQIPDDSSADTQSLVQQAVASINNIVSQTIFEIDGLGGSLFQTPLIFAITGFNDNKSSTEMRYALVKTLLESGADPTVVEKHPMAIGAVIRASVLNQFQILQLLAEHMAPEVFIQEMNKCPAVNGLTALHDTVHRSLTALPEKLREHLAQLEWMVKRGARDDIPDHTGQTQRMLAAGAIGSKSFPEKNVQAVCRVLEIDTSAV